jgi:predicted Zn-dependent protease
MTDPANLSALLSWMNGRDLSMMVAEWVNRLPEEMITKPPVCIAVAETHLQLGDWKNLEKITIASPWGDTEYLRRAMLARALEQIGETEESEKEWHEAVTAAGRHPGALERLVRFATQANWDTRAGELMWVLAKLPGCPQWVVNFLWQTASRRGETAELQKLSATIVKMDPKGIASRNNFAFLSLLTRSEEGDPRRIAENLHRENPENPTIASTYGLSLYQQGRTEEAVRIMSALKPEDLRQPQVALYYAIFLIAAGQSEKGEEYLKLSADWPMLPEEKALLLGITD